jgi:phosphoribosylformylglycinamidine synthase
LRLSGQILQDFEYYTKMFRDEMKRDPTNVELFDIAQSNSEHSRHWYFRGKLVEDGKVSGKKRKRGQSTKQ